MLPSAGPAPGAAEECGLALEQTARRARIPELAFELDPQNHKLNTLGSKEARDAKWQVVQETWEVHLAGRHVRASKSIVLHPQARSLGLPFIC